jgi:hypothetical protein
MKKSGVLLMFVLVVLTGCSKANGLTVKQAAISNTVLPKTTLTYQIVGTGQNKCYDNRGEIVCPVSGSSFFGQDAQYSHPKPTYRDNGDGTISDLVTGLMWVKSRGVKMTWEEAVNGAAKSRVGGYSDWRMPTIKELYSLINFNGAFNPEGHSVPYLDTRYFDFVYGDTSKGERGIDCQDWSATKYTATTMNGRPTAFGVNFADGRIKGYPIIQPQGKSTPLYARYVRGSTAYGVNNFKNNNDGTISDTATGLMWSMHDSGGRGMNWQSALAWVEEKNRSKYLGYSDWRLPDAKELQSIVDYSRIPAIDPIFQITQIGNEEFPYYWTGTTHLDGPPGMSGTQAIYIAFGRALGYLRGAGLETGPGIGKGPPGRGSGTGPPPRGPLQLTDVHGAGAQRSDPKAGDPSEYPAGRGPQGDEVRIYNVVRLVRNI